MPRISSDAPELAVSSDGGWAAALVGGRLHLFDLNTAPRLSFGERATAADAEASSKSSEETCESISSVERPEGAGRIVFLGTDRLLHVFIEPASGDNPAVIAAELLSIPSLHAMGPMVRVSGAQRIVGVGPVGVVVAPFGSGADILCLRAGELVLQRTFMRSEVLSAIPAPERRFLLEQRGGFELWDPATRSSVSRLVLQTRQPAIQIGYVNGGRMLWSLAAGPPVHVEIFRASDGRRILEMDQPGRGLAAESGPGRLVIAVEERSGFGFLDIDLSTAALQRLPLPEGSGKLYSFAVRPSAAVPEILALTEEGGPTILRVPLVRLAKRGAQDEATTQTPGGRSPSRNQAAEGVAPARGGRLREQRPDQRLMRRPPPGVELPGRTPIQPSISSPAAEEPEFEESGSIDAELNAAPPLAITFGGGDSSMPTAADSPLQRRYREMLGRAYDPNMSPAAWQWELMRWAQRALLGSDDGPTSLMPDGGPVQQLGQRLRLTPVAQRVLSLLYAGEHLLGARPYGMRPLEILACLSSLYEEPTVVAETLPSAQLRTLGLIGLRADGRLRLRREVAQFLLGIPCAELLPPASADREALPIGLYGHQGPYTRIAALLVRQPVLRIDGLSEQKIILATRRALQRALVHDAVVVIEGLSGLSFPAFSTTELLMPLRGLLTGLRTPVIVCAMPDALPALGMSIRPLPSSMLMSHGVAAAPLVPSAPLPAGTSWRSPLLPVSSAYLEGNAPSGRLELQVPGDRRAAVVIGPSATPDAYASAAYLAARDGAVLMIDVELTSVRSLVLAMLLRQLPVTVTAVPPGGHGTPWPATLAPFAQ